MKENCSHSLTRRAALAWIGKLGLLAGALGPAALRSLAATSKPQMKFIVVNDTHYMSPECGTYLEGLVKQMKLENPDFCLHAGDLTEKGELAHEEAVRKIFSELGAPCHTVPGNHDWLTPTDRTPYTSIFPRGLNYSFTHRDWQFIGLDTTEGQKSVATRIQPATFEMLKDIQGRLRKDRPTVVFTHFPLCGSVQTRPLNADDLLAGFDGWDVRSFFSGHYHAYTECRQGTATVTTNRCCALKRNNHDGTKQKGYFVCEVVEGALVRRFVEYNPSHQGG
jgi:3',5'-cyclic AMP phosphodiesterase CpdA